MRDHEIGSHVPSGRIKHPELEQSIRSAHLRPLLDRSVEMSIRAISMPPLFHSSDGPVEYSGE